ncbi:MAG: hypothetical protein ACYSUC_06125 [Planctomycetota bacterium]|jgi:hypothetical protein
MAGKLTQAAQQTGAPVAPQLAQAAAAAGAPGPQQQPAAQQPMPGGPQQPAPGGPQQPAPGGPQQVDPTAPAVEGKMPVNEEQASPEEQAEYERGMKALSRVLYSSDEGAQSVVDQIDPNDKISTTTKANILLIQQLDQKIQMNEVIIPQMTQEVTSRVIELAEARYGIEYGGRETQVILGSTWEGVQEIFGGDPQELQSTVDQIGPEGLAGLQKQHEAFLNG